MKKLLLVSAVFLASAACGGAVAPAPEDGAPDVAPDVDVAEADAAPVYSSCYDPQTPLLAYSCKDDRADCSTCPASCTVTLEAGTQSGECH